MSDTWDAFPEVSPAARGGTQTMPGENGAPTRVIMNMGAAPASDPWADFPEQSTGDKAFGMVKQAGVGIAKGAIGLAGLPGDAAGLLKKGVDWVADKLPEIPENSVSKFLRDESAKVGPGVATGGHGDMPGSYQVPDSHDIQTQVEKVTGAFRKPQNQAEADAETVGEFVPAALAGGGGMVRKLAMQAAAPAAATITAGRYSDQNPYVKALAGFVAGGAGAMLSGPGSAAEILRSKIPASVTEADITRAGQLIDHAQRRGVGLTWPEALTRVTGQPVLTDTQRILESHGRTRPQMDEFFAGRPAAVENAARTEFDRMGTVHPNPSSLGAEAGDAANTSIKGVRSDINEASKPFYDASRSVTFSPEEYAAYAGTTARLPVDPNRIKNIAALATNDTERKAANVLRAAEALYTPQQFKQIEKIPGYAESLAAVRSGPNAWRIADLPDNSVGVLNAVKKHFDQMAENAGSKFNPAKNKETQSTHEMAASALKQIGVAKSADYEIALAIQEQARKEILEPILNGPLGKLAKKDPTTQKAIDALFPANPIPGSEGEVRNAVFAIARQRPAVAEQLVRAHAEMVFNEAARDLQGGASQFAGAKFAKVIAGNSQQRANLQAAVEALPNGHARWQGFEHLLDIMQATGARQSKGSLTAFNALEVQSMSSGGLQALAAKGASPGKWWTAATDTFHAWSLGRNLDQLARIITDPRSGNAFNQIIRIPAGTDRAANAVGRLLLTLGASTTEQRAKQ